MITPSGRFQTNTNICMSMSNFHPDTWNPAWSVSTILNGMLSFMVEEEDTTGSIRTSMADRKALARRSHNFNLQNNRFREIFPELCTPQAAPVASGAEKPSEQNKCQKKEQGLQKTQQLKAGTRAEESMRQTASSAAAAAAALVNRNNNTNQRAARVAGLAALPRKWIVLFVLVAYIFASKAISRLLTA
ncbi:Ubiquitin-conjugating enzyme E2 6 [Coemansia sp. RSA 2559]|nr:Ubiquitin-conjugating enzyme E2 6 [Coemansia sp. RSA 2559]